jgi:hypothetical protein
LHRGDIPEIRKRWKSKSDTDGSIGFPLSFIPTRIEMLKALFAVGAESHSGALF